MEAALDAAEITTLRAYISTLVEDLDTTLIVYRRLVDRSNKEHHLLEEALTENRSLKLDLESARWSLQQLQARSTPERTVAWFQTTTPGAPTKVKTKAKRTRDNDNNDITSGTSRAKRQVRMANAAEAMRQWQTPALREDKYRHVTHRKTAATEEAARQAEYAEFY